MLKTVSSISNAIGAVNYKGTWNASTNTPTLSNGSGAKGDYYVVSVAGSTALDGISNWGVGDWVVSNGTAWQRVEGGADGNFVNLSATGPTSLAATSADSFATKTATNNVTVSGSSIVAGGSNANVDVTITPKGTGSTKTPQMVMDGVATPRIYMQNTGTYALEVRVTGSIIEIGSTNNTPVYFKTAGTSKVVLSSSANEMYPASDNTMKLGIAGNRWSEVYAANPVINTSDANEKEQVRDLDQVERSVAIAIKGMFKAFKFKDAVSEKGDAARTHVGAIAQDVAKAFVDAGLDPSKYALFCSDTWYEGDEVTVVPVFDEDGNQIGSESVVLHVIKDEPFDGSVEKTRLGLRYTELLAFVIAAL